MANKWTIKALELEEKISKFHCVPYIFYWDIKRCKFDYRKKDDIFLYIWYLSFLLAIGGVLICTATLTWKLNTSHEEKFPLVSCGSWIFFILLGCLGCGVSKVLMQYSDEFAGCLNLLMEYGKQVESAEKKYSQKSPKISVEDLVGFFAISNVCFLHAVPFVLVPFGLALHPQMDPFHWLLQQILGENYVHELPNFLWFPIITIRFILCFLFCSEVLRTISVMCNIMTLESPIFYKILNHYRRYPLDYHVLSEYDKLFRIRQINVKACGEMTNTAMGVCFLMMAFSEAFCLLGWNMISPAVFGCLVGAVVIQNGITHTVLPMVTKLYDLSSEIIAEWKIKVNSLQAFRMKKHIGMILRHTRPIAFACGNVGTLKKETKRNYFSSLLDGFINVTMTIKEFV